MGQEIKDKHFKPRDFVQFKQRLAEETELLQDWFENACFSQRPAVGGYELETWLIDPKTCRPLAANQALLQAAQNPLLTPELARFNLELNDHPRPLAAGALHGFEHSAQQVWTRSQQIAQQLSPPCELLGIGILPTLKTTDLGLAAMSNLSRYAALNEQLLAQRAGEPFHLDIAGAEPLHLSHDNVMLEAAATSLQIHIQTPADLALRYYNAAILLSAPIMGIGTNSPYLFGQHLWEETRIPVFEQAIRTGGFSGPHGPMQRVSFGSGYARQSLLECFVENQQHYPLLLPMLSNNSDDLPHLRLHNGTIWRWNRPLIGFDADGTPHLRIEHRILPAGPSMRDNIANMALFFGLVHFYANQTTPPESQLEFALAKDNFYRAAQHGLTTRIHWLTGEHIRIQKLLLDSVVTR